MERASGLFEFLASLHVVKAPTAESVGHLAVPFDELLAKARETLRGERVTSQALYAAISAFFRDGHMPHQGTIHVEDGREWMGRPRPRCAWVHGITLRTEEYDHLERVDGAVDFMADTFTLFLRHHLTDLLRPMTDDEMMLMAASEADGAEGPAGGVVLLETIRSDYIDWCGRVTFNASRYDECDLAKLVHGEIADVSLSNSYRALQEWLEWAARTHAGSNWAHVGLEYATFVTREPFEAVGGDGETDMWVLTNAYRLARDDVPYADA